MNELHLFAGAGGGILGGMLLGHTCVCAVEIEPYRRKVLLQRQRDGILPKFPIWDDINTFDGTPWKGLVDVVCGGFPCQDISQANQRAVGIKGERSGLWSEMVRVVREVGPRYVFVENSPRLTIRGLGTCLQHLAQMGYDAKWGVLSAEDAGAPQLRERIWILAHSRCKRLPRWRDTGNMDYQEGETEGNGKEWKRMRGSIVNGREASHLGHSDMQGLKRHGNNGECSRKRTPWENGEVVQGGDEKWRMCPPGVPLLADGVANRMDRIGASGDGQVPAVVKLAWETLSQ